MIVIVEGIDRVGKTTLCNKIGKLMNAPVAHDASGFHGNSIDSHNWDIIKSHAQLMQQNVIGSAVMDRFHLSQFAYSVTFRGAKPKDADRYLRFIEDTLLDVNPMPYLIYVKPENLKRSIEEHGQDITLADEFMNVAYNLSRLKKTTCTYEDIADDERFSNMMGEVLAWAL